MYAQLRTNLPREVMAYTDFAFDDLAGQSKDARRFPSHDEVGCSPKPYFMSMPTRSLHCASVCTAHQTLMDPLGT